MHPLVHEGHVEACRHEITMRLTPFLPFLLLTACQPSAPPAQPTTADAGPTPQAQGPRPKAQGPSPQGPQKPSAPSDLLGGLSTTLGDLKVETVTAAASRAPQYTIPEGCALRYGVNADAFVEMVPANPDIPRQGLNVEGSFSMAKRGEEGIGVLYGQIELAHLREGGKNPASTQPAGTLAETWLSTKPEGRTLSEEDGPTSAWAAYGSMPGMVVFFPALPTAPQPGSERNWPMTLYPRTAGAQVEARRGTIALPEGSPSEPPRGTEITATVTLEGWVRIEGEPAMVLSARWAQTQSSTTERELPGNPDGSGGGKMVQTIDSTGTTVGRYLVLAKGRVLAAQVKSDLDVTLGTSFEGQPPRTLKQKHTLIAEARLVGACAPNEPTAAPLEANDGPDARLLKTWRDLRDALSIGELDKAAAHFAPELRQKHGAKLGDLLRRHTLRYSTRALGFPEMAQSVDRRGDLITTTLVGAARLDPDKPDNTTVHTFIEGREEEGVVTIVRVGSDTLDKDRDWTLLEISLNRLHTNADASPVP